MADPLAYWRPTFQTSTTARIINRTTNPTAFDSAFPIGQQWLNTIESKLWVCTNNSPQAAVWEQLDNLATTLVNGYLQIGVTGSAPANAPLTAGNGISIVNGPGSITISSSANVVIVTSSQTLAPNTTHIVDALSPVFLDLPMTCSVGSSLTILGLGAAFTVGQHAGQMIRFHSMNTSVGVAGSLQSTSQFDCLTLTCVQANTLFLVHPSTGNFNLV